MYELHDGESIKDVKRFEGKYAVTDHGRVWSYKRKKWLSPCNNGHGYLVVRLSTNGDATDKKVHRLVAEAFVQNPHEKPQVNHINGIKADNKATNLCFVTPKENNQHACDQGLNSHFKLLLKDKIIVCKMFYQGGIRKVDIARIFNMSSPGILYIINAYGNQVGHA
jgi:hypothetical protein